MYSDQAEAGRDAFRLFLLVTIFIGVSAAAILYYSLPWGIGVSPDSVAYLKSASRFVLDPQLAYLPSHWPPAYPLFLAMITSFIPSIKLAALLGQVLLFILNTVAFSLVVYHCLRGAGKSQYWIATLAALVFTTNPSVFLAHQYALSEALFIFFLLSGFGACLWFLERGKTFQLLIAALLVGCMPITRYAALPFIPVFIALIYVGRQSEAQPLRVRIWHSLAFAVISVLPLLCWLALNTVERGESTNRTLEYHPVGTTHALQLLEVFISWSKVPGPGILTILVVLCIGSAVVMSVVRLQTGDRQKALAIGLAVAALLYVFFLLISISFMDAYTPLDERILLPVWILLIIVMFIALQAAISSRIMFGLLLSTIISLLFSYGLKTAGQIEYSSRYGLGYNTRGAATSPLLAMVHMEMPLRKLYSNASDYIYLHTGHEVGFLPAIYDANTLKRNPRFLLEMGHILEEIDKEEAAIVYFEDFEFRLYYPTSAQLESEFFLGSTQHFSDGVYFNQFIQNR